MAITRMTLKEIRARGSRLDREAIEATTEEDIRRHMIEDGEEPDYDFKGEDVISPWYIRKRLGLSQAAFARMLRIPVGTLRNWEQHRVAMDPSTIALMTILAREPEAAIRALNDEPA